jgi:5-methylcytosine-specific restriction endonuclease McrA
VIIDEPCLVLNSHWEPITFTTIRTAIEDLTRDMACVIHPVTFEPLSIAEWIERAPKDSRFIKTSGRPVPAPEVIVLKHYGARPPAKVGFNRQNLFKRDEHSCQYCGVELPGSKLQVEHVLPRSKGGPTTWTNCVAACDSCNSRKANQTPRQAGMKLRKKPAAPRWKPGLRIPRGAARPIWGQFVRQGA